MTDAIEDAVVSAARAKGLSISSVAMTTVALDLAGSSIAGSLITIPGKGSLAVADYLNDLRTRVPEGFTSLDMPADKPTDRHVGLTAAYAREIAAGRNQPRLDPSKFTGVTREFIGERQRTAQGKMK
jgi:hypothetical protein